MKKKSLFIPSAVSFYNDDDYEDYDDYGYGDYGGGCGEGWSCDECPLFGCPANDNN